MNTDIINLLTWTVLTLLGINSYFLRGIHSDIKKMREELNLQSRNQVRIEANIHGLEQRLVRLEKKIEA